MKLKKLFKGIEIQQIRGSREVDITGLCANSKLIAPGNLFVAKKGNTNHGARFIAEAVSAGAVAVLTDIYDPSLRSVTQVVHPRIEMIEGEIANRFYEAAPLQLFMVGITGTNGKTTTSYLIRHLLDRFFGPSGLIGTIEYVVGMQRYRAERTTPDVYSNHRLLREMVKQGCHSAVMEVTSHALDQQRISGLTFDMAIFTNLSWDHLDYHETMEEYCLAKSRLFCSNLKQEGVAIVNADSLWSSKVLQGCSANVCTYGITQKADVWVTNIVLTAEGSRFDLHFKGQSVECLTSLIGRFNIYNTLCAITVALLKEVPLAEIVEAVTSFPCVPGRLEPVSNPLGVKVYVDFAHSDEALKNVLACLNELKTGRLFTVFGCGGNRDRSKRPKMAAVCERYSDMTIVTSDNPRTEDPEKICREIVEGFSSRDSYLIELDRRQAICCALTLAGADDIVLIAGKGHEKHQIFAHHTIEFDDCKVVAELCRQESMS